MNNNLLVLQSMASDLKRVSLGLQRNSTPTASRFANEVLRRKSEVDITSVPSYIKSLLDRLDQAVTDPEDSLMFSTLIQNYSTNGK